MKRLIIMLTFIAVLMISGCVQRSYCGDGICDPAKESCDCIDCINTPLCQQQQETPTKEKEITKQEYVCGNGKCEPGEWCNTETLVTPCPEDCPRCPSHIFVEPFRCMPSDKCQKIGDTFYWANISSRLNNR